MNKQTRTALFLATAIAILTGALGYALGVASGQESIDPQVVTVVETSDPFDQANFPCAEDELLGYDQRFGPDEVGCMHIDYVYDLDE